ncbi:endonuclease/exonuclease/phosphatase family protein [Nocardia jejuensis]|uniref:endonuclease/exonuclease/phosphatase family protein n=1 Tax=Nocardia jejuensis TaxID=328049 RepID=UPI00082E62A0|nr:endonuclease/exonuclease/phosphatase family protein [Nocardia jejuensis]
MITVATWNVLHRVHADNWPGPVTEHWPVEAERIAAVTTAVAKRNEQVIALQEVSGDQLASLRRALPGRVFHVLIYPRVPKSRRIDTVLADRSESLVVITDGPSREISAETFDNDPGNGALAIEFEGLTVVATHVSGDRRRDAQFQRLAELAAAPAIVLGDFNVDRAALAAALGGDDSVPAALSGDFTVAEPAPDSLPTRPRSSGAKSQLIDHVVARGVTVSGVQVEDVAGVSDHNLVRATVEFVGSPLRTLRPHR